MAIINISTDEIIKTAETFQKAGVETTDIILKLKKQMAHLEEAWPDANGEQFFQFYVEWDKHIEGFSETLFLISKELNDISDHLTSMKTFNNQ